MKFNLLSKIFSKVPVIQTKNLILREIKKSDVDDMYEYSSNPKTSEFLLWDVHKSKEFTAKFINYIIDKYKSGEYSDWAIEFKHNNKMIGTAGYTKIDETNMVAEIGYVLNPNYWGNGIATEAAFAVIAFAFEKLNMHRVEAKFMQGNDASLGVMKKLGMTFEGYRRDLMFVKGQYRTIGTSSILRDEFERYKEKMMQKDN